MARARGVVVGLGASWIKALTEPRLQSVAERILPPSPAQKQEVGADPAGRPENMPPAVLANRTAVALGHGGPTARQRLRVQEAIPYGFGAGLGAAYSVAAKQWRVVSRGRGALAGLAIYASTHASVLPALGIKRPPWRLAPAAVLWESASHVVFGTAVGERRASVALVLALFPGARRCTEWLGDVITRDESGFILTGGAAGAEYLLESTIPGVLQPVTSASSALGSAHRREQIATRLLAATTDLRADAAVIMVRRVVLALNGARTTHDDARLDRCPNDAQIDFGLAGQDAADRVADIGAVEIEPDGPDQLQCIWLAKTGVGAAGARGGTVVAVVNTAQEQVTIQAHRPGMSLDDVSNRHVVLLRVALAA
jgi:putative membrane protein